jgi:hypothetical protein
MNLSNESMQGIALHWFAQMQAGQIDRTQLDARYNAHLTADAVQTMSQFLTAHHYGASPTGAQVLRKDARGDQTFYLTKLLFPRGDAASLLFGFDGAGKITGISLLSMAGD